jgi:hypothetical protein
LRPCHNPTRRDAIRIARSTEDVTPTRRGHRSALFLACALSGAAPACGPADPPAEPTWADVEPILRGECGSCHSAGAAATGGGVRFDFYDLTTSPCGDAAQVLGDTGSARAQSDMIAKAITTTDPGVRPIMPPPPAPYLTDDEWQTILRWTARPMLGDKPPNNLPPRISVDGTPLVADKTLDLHAIVEDPEGDPVVGVLYVGDQTSAMDRAGSFAARFDTSSWPAGVTTVSALLCDGWSKVYVPLLSIAIQH